MTALRLPPGTVLSGRYQVGEVIGESDLSVVYSAKDQRGQAQVALKVFHPAVKDRAAALSEYQSQARQASGLGVEGIARAYDFGIDANSGVPFSTAELIGWASLDRRVLSQGPLGVADLARAVEVLARALDAAHARGVAHRDLKPQNVFISPDNPEWARLTDFGVGAVRRGAPEALGWGGPPGYTPAEAVDAAAPASPAADLFALGVIAFFALTRATPFRSLRSPGFDPNAHWAELNQPLSPLSERAKEVGVALDAALDGWFARALALDPRERFPNAGEMSRELTAVAEQLGARGGTRTFPGIATAIAQPLVFQPEPPLSLAAAGTMPVTTAALAAVAAAPPPPPAPSPSVSDTGRAPEKKSLALPLMLGLGVLLVAGLGVAGYAALGSKEETSTPPASPSAPPATATPEVPPPPVPAPVAPAKAAFSCLPEACEAVVCDGKNVALTTSEVELAPGSHECSASRSGFTPQTVTFTATAGETSAVRFELAPVPARPQSTPKPATVSTPPKLAAKTAAAAASGASKPAASSIAVKASAATKSKKKCSPFLGCK